MYRIMGSLKEEEIQALRPQNNAGDKSDNQAKLEDNFPIQGTKQFQCSLTHPFGA